MIAKSAVITLVALAVPTVLAQQPAWAQCGGQGYQGSTTCVSGYTCKYTNQYWSQCVPGAAATTAVPTTTKTSTVSAPTGVPTAGYGDVPLGGSCDPSEPYSNFCAYPYDCSPYNGLCVEPSRNSLKRNGEVCLGADIYNRACAIGDCVPSTLICTPSESSGVNFRSIGESCSWDDRRNRQCVQGAKCTVDQGWGGKCVAA